jgi:hypothetical protein
LAIRNRLYWERLVAGLPEEDPRCAAIANGIAHARELAEAPAADSNGQRGRAGLQHVQACIAKRKPSPKNFETAVPNSLASR